MASRLHYIPIVIVILITVLFISTYAIAVGTGHINAFFSYISDTGTKPQEMCIFTFGLNLAVCLFFGLVHIRYKQLTQFLDQTEATTGTRTGRNLNLTSAILGYVAAIGIGVVGAFQETSNFLVHILGAVLAFGVGSIYLTIEGFQSLKMSPQFVSLKIAYVRLFAGISCFFMFWVCQLTGGFAIKSLRLQKKAEGLKREELVEHTLKWNASDAAWELRITSTVTEWIMAAVLLLGVLTFAPEFKDITFIPAQIKLPVPDGPQKSADTVITIAKPEANHGDDYDRRSYCSSSSSGGSTAGSCEVGQDKKEKGRPSSRSRPAKAQAT